MRVMFVINSLGASGAEHSTAALLPHLRSRGHEIHISTLYDAGFGDEDRIRRSGFDVRPLAGKSLASRVRELRRRIRSFDPDIVHTALFDADLVGRLAAFGARARVVSSLVNTTYDPARLLDPAVSRWKLRLTQAVDAVTGRLAVDRFHAVSRGVAEANRRALLLPTSRIAVVERGRSRSDLGMPSPARRAEVRARLGVHPDAVVVLAVGRQEYQKNHIALIDAAEHVLTGRQEELIVVLVAGRAGNASASVRRHLGDHPQAAAVIRFLGHRHDVPDLLCAADVLAITSTYEGTAGVAIEAMALDCPVVSTNLAGLRGILCDGVNALLVPQDDPVAFATALSSVIDDPLLADQLRRNGRNDFEARFTSEASAAAMEALYRSLVGDGGGT